ncbi:MAG TPA: phage tail sheath subtilisin-like domain-containing protein [Pyrinomonadaceae bacterium]|nr:phage tail sheath subtilisin-like domain-containing protein [Pyrinomonadaceae bacterium]
MAQSVIVESTKPGVTAIVNAGQVARPVERQPTSTFFVVGYSPWGPANTPRVVTSWADYVRQFGGFDSNSYMDDALYAFFNFFPGATAIVCRVVGGGADVDTLNLKDRSADAGINTLRVDAKYPSTRVDVLVTIEDGTDANTFKLTVRSVLLNRKEIYDNRSMSNAASLAEINDKSLLITVTDLNSATAAPNDNPRVLVETALAGGTDDFSNIIAANYIGEDNGDTRTGLQTFNDEAFGTGQVAIPGITTDPTHAALVAHAETFHRLALLDPPLASDKEDVAGIRDNYGTWYGAVYWPWVEVLDYSGSGAKRFVPPSGFAAGECALADRTIGSHKAPANIRSIPNALGVELTAGGVSQTDDNTREYLNSRDVNVIAPLPEQGVRVYGARVMTADRRIAMVHQIRVMNLIYYSLKKGFGWAVFAVIDGKGRLFRDLRSTASAFLRSLYTSGALWGKTEEEAFIVVADETNNPPEELENGRVHVQVGVKIVQTAEQIIINVDNVPLFQDLNVLQQ